MSCSNLPKKKQQFYSLGLAISFREAKLAETVGDSKPVSASYFGLEGVFGRSEKHLDQKNDWKTFGLGPQVPYV